MEPYYNRFSLRVVGNDEDDDWRDTPCKTMAKVEANVRARGSVIEQAYRDELDRLFHWDAADQGNTCPCGRDGSN